MPQEYLTMKEVAARLQVSDWTVRRLMRDGLLPFKKLGHRTVRIDPADLAAYMQAKK